MVERLDVKREDDGRRVTGGEVVWPRSPSSHPSRCQSSILYRARGETDCDGLCNSVRGAEPLSVVPLTALTTESAAASRLRRGRAAPAHCPRIVRGNPTPAVQSLSGPSAGRIAVLATGWALNRLFPAQHPLLSEPPWRRTAAAPLTATHRHSALREEPAIRPLACLITQSRRSVQLLQPADSNLPHTAIRPSTRKESSSSALTDRSPLRTRSITNCRTCGGQRVTDAHRR